MAVVARRTQEERSAATRGKILVATVACLTERGYHGTTTTAVQELAGVSRGALMHHFPCKADLLVGAVRHLAEQRAADLAARARRLPPGPDRIGPAIDLLWGSFQGPLFTATMELWGASRTDPELRAALLVSERSLRLVLEDLLADLFGAEVAASARFAEAVELTLQFLRGAAMTAILRRDDARQQAVIDSWKRVFTALVR